MKSVLFSVLGVRAAFPGEELGPEVGVSVVAPDLERDEVVEFVVAVLGVGDAVAGEDPLALGGRDVPVVLGPPGDADLLGAGAEVGAGGAGAVSDSQRQSLRGMQRRRPWRGRASRQATTLRGRGFGRRGLGRSAGYFCRAGRPALVVGVGPSAPLSAKGVGPEPASCAECP